MAGQNRKRLYESCPHCNREMRKDNIARHLPHCKANPVGRASICKALKKAQDDTIRLLKNAVKAEKKVWKQEERMLQARRRVRAQLRQSLTKFKMKGGLDVAACG